MGKIYEAFVDGLFVEVGGGEVVVEELMSFGRPAWEVRTFDLDFPDT